MSYDRWKTRSDLDDYDGGYEPKTVMCGDCQGQGTVSPWFRGPWADEAYDVDCEVCGGTGEVEG